MISEGASVVHLADFVNGYPFRPDELTGAGLPVVRIRQLLDDSADADRAVPPARAVRIDNGELVFSWSAVLAVRLWSGGPALLNQHLFKVIPRPGVERRWLRYVLHEAVRRLRPLMHGSAMTHITLDMLRAVRTAVPRLDWQRAITSTA
jgi:type I restriction enzyme S subunit